MIHFSRNESEIKKDAKNVIFSRGFVGPDTGWKEKEYAKIVFILYLKLLGFVISDDKTDISYSLNKIILNLFPIFWTCGSRALTTWIRCTSQVA